MAHKQIKLKKLPEPKLQEISFQGKKKNIVDERLEKSYKKMKERGKK